MKKELLFLESHEWVLIEGNTALFGISEHAQDSLGEVVFVDLPSVGTVLKQKDTFGAVESVKAASDLYAPISGKVIAVNEALLDQPELINENAYDAWLIKIEIVNLEEAKELLTQTQYEATL